jgi:hypothetical protein
MNESRRDSLGLSSPIYCPDQHIHRTDRDGGKLVDSTKAHQAIIHSTWSGESEIPSYPPSPLVAIGQSMTDVV